MAAGGGAPFPHPLPTRGRGGAERQPPARRHLAVLAALAAGLLVMLFLEVLYRITLGRFVPLTGIPTPGGAPLYIHVLSMGIKGGWGALAYGLIMRAAFGKVVWSRVALLWLAGLAVVALCGRLADSGTMPVDAAVWTGIAAYWIAGQFVARDWVSR